LFNDRQADCFGLTGTRVKAGETLVVLSAMKMETAVGAPCSGVVQHVAVSVKDNIEAGAFFYLLTYVHPEINIEQPLIFAFAFPSKRCFVTKG
jgi:Biotin-requiring enzyme